MSGAARPVPPIEASRPEASRPELPRLDTAQPSPASRCFTIVTDGRTFGLPVEAIQTVFEIVAVTPVPLAPVTVLGLVNPARQDRHGHQPATPAAGRCRRRGDVRLAVGIEHRGENFALIVDEVGDVIMLDGGTRIEIPPHLGAAGAKIAAVHRLDTLILPVLDLDWVLDFGSDT